MRRIARRITTPLFALLFAASLAFGVGSSFAQAERAAPAAATCPDDGWSINAGACASQLLCRQKCQGRNYLTGDCLGGIEGNCCVCVE